MATKPFLSQIAVPVGTTTGDVYYPQTSLLMHFNGTNGSTTMTDSSKNNFTVTATNGAAISTVQSKFGGSSAFFDGTNDFLSISNNAEFNFVTGIFTVELWAYFSSVSGQRPLVTNYQNSTNGWAVQLYLGKIFASFSGDGIDIQGTTTILTNTWYHIAVSGTPGSYKLFLNGVQEGPTYTGGTTLSSTSALTIGQIVSSAYFNGYIDELRITNGVARYTSNFTPPTTQFLDSAGDANSNVVVNSTATGFAIGTGGINGAQLAKAWVNFNGTSTVAIRDSYNVSSITDNATGQYYVNFSTPMNNTNYSVVGCNATSISNFAFTGAAPDTINRCLIGTYAGGAGSFQDYSNVQALVFSN